MKGSKALLVTLAMTAGLLALTVGLRGQYAGLAAEHWRRELGTVPDEQAAFTVLGAIALQGLRLAAPTLGERFMVFGAGLAGLLTVQLLRANGCRVLAVDLNAERLALAARFGAETVDIAAGGDPVAAAEAWTGGAFPFDDGDLADFPLSHAELAPYYDLVAERIGIAGCEDDLARFVPVHAHLLDPLDHIARYLPDDLQVRLKNLHVPGPYRNIGEGPGTGIKTEMAGYRIGHALRHNLGIPGPIK